MYICQVVDTHEDYTSENFTKNSDNSTTKREIAKNGKYIPIIMSRALILQVGIESNQIMLTFSSSHEWAVSPNFTKVVNACVPLLKKKMQASNLLLILFQYIQKYYTFTQVRILYIKYRT